MKIKLLDKKCKPYRAHPTDSGLDLRARLDDTLVLYPMWHAIIPAGIAIKLPAGYEAQIRPRSGMSAKGVISPFGTIDNGYTGELKMVLINTSMERIVIEPYERIAQLVVAPVEIFKIEYVDELPETERGKNGLGSSGLR